MCSSTESNLGPLIDALTWYDNDSRMKRAERIAWASSLYKAQGVVAGRIVPMHLMEEARISFVNGQFMAVILSATSVIEHLLVDELDSNSTSGNMSTFAAVISCARSSNTFSPQLLDGADELRKLRSPLVHRNADAGKYSLYERYRRYEIHPSTLLEADARFA